LLDDIHRVVVFEQLYLFDVLSVQLYLEHADWLFHDRQVRVVGCSPCWLSELLRLFMLFGGFIVVFIFLWLVSEVIVDSFLLFLLFVRILLLVWLAASLHHDWTFVNWSCLFVVHYLVI